MVSVVEVLGHGPLGSYSGMVEAKIMGFPAGSHYITIGFSFIFLISVALAATPFVILSYPVNMPGSPNTPNVSR